MDISNRVKISNQLYMEVLEYFDFYYTDRKARMQDYKQFYWTLSRSAGIISLFWDTKMPKDHHIMKNWWIKTPIIKMTKRNDFTIMQPKSESGIPILMLFHEDMRLEPIFDDRRE